MYDPFLDTVLIKCCMQSGCVASKRFATLLTVSIHIAADFAAMTLQLTCKLFMSKSRLVSSCSHVQAAHAQASAAFQAAQHAQQAQQAQHGQGFVMPLPPPPTNPGFGTAPRGPFVQPGHSDSWNRGKTNACCKADQSPNHLVLS